MEERVEESIQTVSPQSLPFSMPLIHDVAMHWDWAPRVQRHQRDPKCPPSRLLAVFQKMFRRLLQEGSLRVQLLLFVPSETACRLFLPSVLLMVANLLNSMSMPRT